MSGGDWKEMFNAGCEGNLALVEHHVKSGVDVNYAHPEFLSTPLVAAILARQEAVALYLLDHGAHPTLPSEFDAATPIQAARQTGWWRWRSGCMQWGFPGFPRHRSLHRAGHRRWRGCSPGPRWSSRCLRFCCSCGGSPPPRHHAVDRPNTSRHSSLPVCARRCVCPTVPT